MNLTAIAVLLAGIWLVLVASTAVSNVLTLIFGIVIIVLVVVDNLALLRR